MGDFVVDFALWLGKFIACSLAGLVAVKTVVRRATGRQSKGDAGQQEVDIRR